MNETDFIRQQLRAERSHLREILEAERDGAAAPGNARPAALYIGWAGRRLVQQLTAHHGALTGLDGGPATALLDPLRIALQSEGLLALLDAWTEQLDTLAGTRLRVAHWRTAAGLSADSILQERLLYAAARSAAGLT